MGASSSESHVGVYFRILLVLLFLTVATVAIAQVDFGSGSVNLIVAMVVASIKALLVGAYFMHLKYEDKLIWFYAAIPVVLLFIMLVGVFIDTPFRAEVGPDKAEEVVASTSGNSDSMHH